MGSALLTEKLMSKFSFSDKLYGVISTGITGCIMYALTYYSGDKLNIFTICIVISIISILSILLMLYKNYKLIIEYFTELLANRKTVIYVYDSNDICIIMDYVYNHTKIFKHADSTSIGSHTINAVNFNLHTLSYYNLDSSPVAKFLRNFETAKIPESNKPMIYHDTYFDLKVVLTVKYYSVLVSKLQQGEKNSPGTESLNVPYIILKFEPGKNYINYVDDVKHKVIQINNHLKHGFKLLRTIQKDNKVEIFSKSVCIEDSKNYDFHVYLQNYMKSFFHEKKDKLINKIVRNNTVTPRITMLLHGPPGTGKSSFAYRLAKIFNRNIISIDLKK